MPTLPDCKTYRSRRDESRPYWSTSAVWKGLCLTNQRYARDNRLIIPKSPYRRNCLAPRCWLIISWGWRRSQGFGCSPNKMVPELSLERRETVWILPGVRVKELWKPRPCTRGPDVYNHWSSNCFAESIVTRLRCDRKRTESISSSKLFSRQIL